MEIIKPQLTEKDLAALERAVDHVAIVSITDKNGTITYVNDKFVEISKYPREELIGQNHRILKSGHQSEELFVNLWQTIASGRVWRGEIKNRAKDNTYYWVDTSIAPTLDENGVPEQYIAVRFLITERKQIEEEMSQKIRELQILNNAAIGRELKMVELKERLKSCNIPE